MNQQYSYGAAKPRTESPLSQFGEPRAVKTFGEDRTLIYSVWEREIMDAAA